MAIIFLLPSTMRRTQTFKAVENYRTPYPLSSDYWILNNWIDFAAKNHAAVVMGDSVIWGQYVTREETFSARINERCGTPVLGNLGVDGMHPAAMNGLIKHYGKSLQHIKITLHFNALWMSSPQADLSAEEEFRFNHPRLVPQLVNRPTSYKPTFSEIADVTGERLVPFLRLINHLRLVHFENMDIKNWSILYPYKIPFFHTQGTVNAMFSEDTKTDSVTVPGPGRRDDLDWVAEENSYQWFKFKKNVELLEKQNNTLFVIIGPFNTNTLSEKGLAGYSRIINAVEKWLQEKSIPYFLIDNGLDDADYADATHPFAEGYEKIADQLMAPESDFKQWLLKDI